MGQMYRKEKETNRRKKSALEASFGMGLLERKDKRENKKKR
jgi:hypothetical protein